MLTSALKTGASSILADYGGDERSGRLVGVANAEQVSQAQPTDAPTLPPTEPPVPTDPPLPPSETPVPPAPTEDLTDTPPPNWLAVAAVGVATAVGGGAGQLAFVSERDRNPELYIMELDGSPIERLTVERMPDTAPSWSPDGSRIAFVSSDSARRISSSSKRTPARYAA